MTLSAINPATGKALRDYPEHSPAEVEHAIQLAFDAQKSWRRRSVEERARMFTSVSQELRENRSRYAQFLTSEMGKPIVEAEAEVDKCAVSADWFAETGPGMLADVELASNASLSVARFQPLGVVLAVMPWNFPFWQVFRAAIPALIAGNTMLLKHAANVPGSADAIEEVFRAAGFPEGVFQNLRIRAAAVEPIIKDPRVAAVTLTGSEPAGIQVATTAGSVLKKAVLELGGSDPFIVLDDADLDLAVPAAVRSRNQNAGQSCIAAKRFIVVEAVAAEFEQRFAAGVAALRIGDPEDRTTQVGPMARADLVSGLDRQVAESVKAGARVLVGGRPADRPGFYYEPTVLAGVDSTMTAFREETFGPVAAVIRVRDENEAIAVANDSDFGLGAAIWTRDVARGSRLADEIESGMVFVNGMVASDARLPFGGVKRSGYGRELSEFGIREFVNVKTVWIGPVRPE